MADPTLEELQAEQARRELNALMAEQQRRAQATPEVAAQQGGNPFSRAFGALARADIAAPPIQNDVSEFFGDLADSSVTSSGDTLLDSAARSAARVASLAASPNAVPVVGEKAINAIGAGGEAFFKDPLGAIAGAFSSTGEIAPELLEVGPNLAAGDVKAAGENVANATRNTAETVLNVAFPGAAAVTRQGGRRLLQEGAEQALKRTATSTERAAANRLTQADPDIGDAITEALTRQAQGQPVAPADLANRQAQSVVKAAARRDGPAIDIAQRALDPRQAEQFQRVSNDIRTAFGVRGDFLEHVDAIKLKRASEAQPLYRQAYATPTRATPKLVELLNRPPLKKAFKDAEELAAISGETLAPIAKGQPVNTRTLHVMRRALDDQISTFRDPTSGKLVLNERGRALVELRKEFNTTIRKNNNAFRLADEAWSGESSAISALELGRRLSRKTTETDVRSVVRRGLNGEDRELFEAGFAQGLEESIGRSGSQNANVTLKLLSPEKQKIIRTVLGDQRGEEFLDRVRVENLMTQARNRISPNVGSDTAENLQQTSATALSIVNDLVRGSTTAAALKAGRVVGGRKVAERQARVDEQIVRLATEDPERLQQLILEASQPRPSIVGIDLRGPGAVAGVNATDSQ